jgi:outer membrane protein TolC
MDEHLDTIRAAAEAHRAAQEQVVAARERLQEAMRLAWRAGIRTDLIQQAAALPTSTFYRLLGGIR